MRRACAEAGRDPLVDAVPWDAVVELMHRKRTAMQCRQKWCVLPKEVADDRRSALVNGEHAPPGPHNARRVDRRKLLQRLRELGVGHENDINWRQVPTEAWAVRPALLKDIWKELRKRVVVPDRQEMTLSGESDDLEL